MKISVSSNIYEVTAEGVLEIFESFVTPPARSGGCLAAALSTNTLSPQAKNAIEKSLESLGYGVGRCAFVICAAEGMTLGGSEALTIIEGIDPLCLIIADESSANIAKQGYRANVEADKAGHLLGRPYVAFRDFESMLAEESGKQKAWALLKQLPKL